MKKLFILPLAILAFACGNTEKPAAEDTSNVEETMAPEITMAYFGAEITPDAALEAAEIGQQLAGKDSVRLKVSGNIEKVCQMKGCWMTMKSGEQDMHVTFKDYGFFVPKDAMGNKAIIEGYAYVDTMDVETLKHYAEDEGKSEEEIAMITEPEIKLSFVADGVIIEGYEAKSEEATEETEHHHEHGEEGHVH